MSFVTSLNTHKVAWKHALRNIFRINATLGAAGIAFFVLFSIFPLILVIVAIASLWFDPLWVEGQLADQLEFIIPGFTDLLGENFERIIEERNSITQFSSLFLIWSASSMFSIMARTLDTIQHKRKMRTGFRYRGLALLFVALGGLIVLPALFILTTGIPLIARFIPELISKILIWISPIISILVGSLFFGLIYRYVPHSRPRWRVVWQGAIVCGILWELAKRGFQYYTSHYLSVSNLVYGSFTTIMAFLMWVYISGLIFFFGAHLINSYEIQHERQERQQERVLNN